MSKYNIKKIAVVLFYANNKRTKKEIRATIHFIIDTNNIKCLKVIPPKQMKDLYDKNFQSLKKETEEDAHESQDQHSRNGHLSSSNLQIQCHPH